MTFQLRPSMVKPSDLSKAGRSMAYDESGTGKVARDIVIASTIGGGGAGLVRRFPTLFRKIGLQAYKHGVPAFVNYLALKPAIPAIRGDRKVGIRFGADKFIPMGTLSGPLGMYVLPSLRRLPVPIFGFGLTAVPNDQSRLPGMRSKSRGGEDVTSTGTPRSTRTATKTIVGPLAKTGSPIGGRPPLPPAAPGRGYGGDRRRQKGPVRPRRTSPPYCWRHKRRHYCKFVK